MKPCTPFLGYAAGGTLVTGGGSGATTPAYINYPLGAIQARAIQDGNTTVYWGKFGPRQAVPFNANHYRCG